MRVVDFVILVVEDDPEHVALIQRILAKANLVNPVRVVRDGQEAMDYLSGRGAFTDRNRHPLPSLVFLDLNLPRKSGLEVLTWMRGDPRLKTLPVVLLAASAEGSEVRRALALGVNSVLLKPVRFDDLLEMVKSVGMYWMILNWSPEHRALSRELLD